MRESPFDGIYSALFVVTALEVSMCIQFGDWIDLVFFTVPFVGWTLSRGGFKGAVR